VHAFEIAMKNMKNKIAMFMYNPTTRNDALPSSLIDSNVSPR
jgi:hypothetical protein